MANMYAAPVTLIVRRADGRVYAWVEGQNARLVSEALADAITAGVAKLKNGYSVVILEGFAMAHLTENERPVEKNLVAMVCYRRPKKVA